MELVEHPFDLREIIGDVVGLFEWNAGKRGVRLHAELDPGADLRFRGDSGRLRQVIANLTGNAVKFTHSGEICISVSSETLHPGQAKIRVAVTDTGVGIPEDRLESIFAGFSQGHHDVSTTYGGSGLGLTICKTLVELMGGEIRVESEVGKGSRFSFELTLNQAATEVALIGPGARPDSFAGMSVLVAEDTPVNQKVVTLMLEKWGCQVQLAINGREAVDLMAQNNFDLILMDCLMPVTDGVAAGVASCARDAAGAINPLTKMAIKRTDVETRSANDPRMAGSPHVERARPGAHANSTESSAYYCVS